MILPSLPTTRLTRSSSFVDAWNSSATSLNSSAISPATPVCSSSLEMSVTPGYVTPWNVPPLTLVAICAPPITKDRAIRMPPAATNGIM